MEAAQKIEELVPNSKLGHYIILEHLADGGMGHVYRAFEPSLNREVAIKVLNPCLAQSSKHVDFFEGEAQKIAALRHPNIVPIYFIGKQGELRYFVMAFVAGGATLDNWIDTSTPLTIEQAFWVMGQAIDALSAALKHNIIHLDIKPSNFLVDAKGESILLTDFGLARSLIEPSDFAQERESFGTPAYMCPEQILNNSVDQRSDIYSLGAAMYHLMTTKMLFERDTIEEIILAHCESPFPHREAEAAGLSSGWINLFDRMTQKDPKDRFQDYEELRSALAHVDQLGPVGARVVQEPTEELITVPNRSNETKEYLYGLLNKSCSHWAAGKVDSTITRSKMEILDQVNKPMKPMELAGFTQALLELQELAAPDVNDLVEALEMMPEMRTFIIALANVGIFKPEGPISASKGAVQAIGLELAHHLILSDVILRKTPPLSKEFDWWPLVQHSISTGIVASKLLDYFDRPADTGRISQMAGKLLHLVQAKTRRLAYLGGFMHDIGKMILGEVAAYPYFVAMKRALEEKRPLHLIEMNVLGVDHHDIGELWCSKFNFDHAIKDAVAHHHIGVSKSSTLRSVVFVANQLVKHCGLGYSGSPVVETRDVCATAAWEQLRGHAAITPDQFQNEFGAFVNQLPLLAPLQKTGE
ncbi:MAG: protein kinase domain-containing protein [Verrucomicrobiota bacterium]